MSEMPRAGVRPNVVSCNAAIKACGEAGQWQHALAILRGMPNAGVSPDAVTYNSAIAALGIAGQNEQASSRVESSGSSFLSRRRAERNTSLFHVLQRFLGHGGHRACLL